MTPYCNQDGREFLLSLRLGSAPANSGGRAPIRLLARVPSEECGCPEEVWQIDGAIYLIHLEAEAGTGEILQFLGDDDQEITVAAHNLDTLRAAMFAHHAGLGRDN
jgi:hypothetical protein